MCVCSPKPRASRWCGPGFIKMTWSRLLWMSNSRAHILLYILCISIRFNEHQEKKRGTHLKQRELVCVRSRFPDSMVMHVWVEAGAGCGQVQLVNSLTEQSAHLTSLSSLRKLAASRFQLPRAIAVPLRYSTRSVRVARNKQKQ